MTSVLKPDENKLNAIYKATQIDQALMEAHTLWMRWLVNLKRQLLPYYFLQPPLWRVLLRRVLSKERMVPNFASLGVVRSGTSLLADYIMQHPCVILPLAKEIGVSSTTPTAGLLQAQFPTLHEKEKVERKYGMAITGYCAPDIPNLSFPFFASAIANNAKMIIILRNPVERTFAHWRWDEVLLRPVKNDSLWRNRPDFDGIIRFELEALNNHAMSSFAISGVGRGYVQHSIYLPFIKILSNFYKKDNMLFINASDFFSNPITTVKKVYTFLGLPQYDPAKMPVRNAAPPAKMSESTRQLLVDFFIPLNKQLYEYIGIDFGWDKN